MNIGTFVFPQHSDCGNDAAAHEGINRCHRGARGHAAYHGGCNLQRSVTKKDLQLSIDISAMISKVYIDCVGVLSDHSFLLFSFLFFSSFKT